MTPTRKINAALQRAGRAERLVRSRAGYYYVSGVSGSSGLYVHRLDDTPRAHQAAFDHVAEVLKNEGIPLDPAIREKYFRNLDAGQ